jgi:non-ribosomal peptide synthase protein (TIGR01720 family)
LTLTDLLQWRAATQGDHEAYAFLVDGEDERRTLTYGELDRWAQGVAAQLKSIASPGDRAIILLPTGLEYLAAFYGCLYAGLVVLPAYPPHPGQGPGALENILQDAGARIALTTADLAPTVREVLGAAIHDLQILTTDTVPTSMERDWQEPATKPDDLAWLQYTSGSTSAPKGVMFSHARVLVGMSHITSLLEVTEESRIVLWLPLHFTVGLNWVMLVPIYTGASVTFMAPDVFLERPLRWLQAISRTGATHSIGPNFAFDLCARVISPEERADLDLSTWKAALCGGEATRPDTFDHFGEAFAEVGFRMEAFANGYGMTEALSFVANPMIGPPVVRTFDRAALERNRVVRAAPDDATERSFIGCGRPLAEVRVAIVDPETRVECPAGRVGELWISSPAVALGYWNRPEATAETFGAYLSDSGEGPFLRTGDLGFFHDGQLFVTGRLKETIIIRGRNLYPQDIERTVERSHPAVRPECGGAFSVDVGGEEQLALVYEVEGEIDPSAVVAAIRGAIAAKHDVQPYGVVLLRPDTVPRTTTGKLQRSGCRQAFLERRLEAVQWSVLGETTVGGRKDYVAPRTETERRLAIIWEAVLGVDQVGIDDDFFALGGDSLLSVQLAARARQQGIGFSPAQLREHRTIAALAPVVGQPHTVLAEQGIVSGRVPLTPRQLHFFRTEVRREDGNITLCEVRGALDPSLTRHAVEHLLLHHDALRTRFSKDGYGWHASIAEREENEVFTYLDVSKLPQNDRARRVEKAVRQARGRIDIEHGPLLQAVHFTFDPGGESRLVFLIHHLVIDPSSINILVEDFELAHEQLRAGDPMRLPPKTSSIKTWAERLVEYAQSPLVIDELKYWLSAIPDRVAPLPLDHPDALGSKGRMRRVFAGLDPEETHALFHLVPRVYGAQSDKVVLAALARAFREWSGRPGLLIELTSHGREPLFQDVDVSRTVGWFTTHFPIFLEGGNGLTLREEVKAVEDSLSRVPNSGISYGILRYLCQDRTVIEALEKLPRADVTLNYVGRNDASRVRLSHFLLDAHVQQQVTGVPGRGHGRVKVVSTVYEGRFFLRYGFHDGVYDQASIERLAELVRASLRAMLQ